VPRNRTHDDAVEKQEAVPQDAVIEVLNPMLVDVYTGGGLDLLVGNSAIGYLLRVLLRPKPRIVGVEEDLADGQALHFEFRHVSATSNTGASSASKDRH
jgi:hypothetical protein